MRRSRPKRTIVFCLAVAAVLLVAAPAGAKHKRKPGIYVSPGPDAISKAIDRAKAGQTIRIRRGRYHEALVIDKPVRLMAAGKIRPVIDGDCATQFTVAVRSSNVILRRLRVVGADEGHGAFPSEVDFNSVSTGRARGLIVKDTCDAEYGINVFGTGPIELLNNEARGGFSDAGIYIGGITDTQGGALRVKGNISYGNNRGIIVEDSSGVDLRVTANRLYANTIPAGEGEPSGLFLHRSDGILTFGNFIHDNGHYGIHLDDGSENNVLIGNAVSSNPINFLAESSGNCGSGNTGFSVPAC
jgi:parallel beta-helix repeat protein